MNISHEQQNIVDQLAKYNVIVDCVAGSGKTTTALFIAEAYPELNILLLTYNKRLKFETRTKSSKFKNLEVHTFHSYFTSYYAKDAYTDDALSKSVNLKDPSIKTTNKTRYNIIIVDEAQDLTILYLKVVRKIIKDSFDFSGHVCIMGDQRQSIYAYNGADRRFLKYADIIVFYNILGLDGRPWIRCNLSETYRLTQNMANFVNQISDSSYGSIDKQTIVSKRVSKLNFVGSDIRYVLCNQFSSGPYKEVEYYLSKNLRYADIIIIAPSLKKGAPVTLANMLTSNKIPIYYPVSDSEELDKNVIDNKLVFCTIHQAKGLERKAVILYNFDEAYYKMYNRSADPNELSNELYVALTRSSDWISLIWHNSNEQLSFAAKYFDDVRNTRNYSKIEYNKVPKNKKKEQIQTDRVIAVTNLLKHIPHDIISSIADNIIGTEIQKPGSVVDIPTIIYQNHTELNEQVSEITGTGIPAYYEWLTTGLSSINGTLNGSRIFKDFGFTEEQVKSRAPKFNVQESTVITPSMFLPIKGTTTMNITNKNSNTDDKKVLTNMEQLQKLLYLSNQFSAINSGVNAKMFQIENYNWITKEQLDMCVSRLDNILNGTINKDHIEYEVLCSGTLYSKQIAGYMDALDHKNKIIYEFKCTKNIERLHMIQMYLYYKLNEGSVLYKDYKYKIFNIFTDQLIELDFSLVKSENLERLIKFKNRIEDNDEKFIIDTKNSI